MADRIQARAIRRCGELLKQIESGQGSKNQYTVLHDAADTKQTRSEVAATAGLSERQKVTALRVASVPRPEFDAAVTAATRPNHRTACRHQRRPLPVAALGRAWDCGPAGAGLPPWALASP